ncbi:signal peptidase II [Abyssibacter sp.]|uniref:signal peptidase II n=1 Tax=Abyssibacter sp. TaxID=2320200 RepID=UPI0025BE725F|nr:signal peptidase II [Abyssibacter sp.]
MAFRATNVHWLWLSAAIILLDQVTKQLVFRSLLKYERIELLPILNLTHLHNTGAAFSMFAEFPPWVFIVLGVAVSVWILWWLRNHPRDEHLLAVALCLVLGGALGNVIDRAARGYVVDFIDFHWQTWHYPAFNVADIAITLGALMLVLDMLLSSRRASSSPNA